MNLKYLSKIPIHNQKDFYVKIPKNVLGNNIPNKDLFLSQSHLLNINFVDATLINNRLKNTIISVNIECSKLVDKISGISLIEKKFPYLYNMTFSELTSVNGNGMDCLVEY